MCLLSKNKLSLEINKMLNTIAIISLIISVLSAASSKIMEIFELTEKDLGQIVVNKEVNNG